MAEDYRGQDLPSTTAEPNGIPHEPSQVEDHTRRDGWNDTLSFEIVVIKHKRLLMSSQGVSLSHQKNDISK